MKKYLFLLLVLTSCEKLTKADIDMARCICGLSGAKLKFVERKAYGGIDIKCSDNVQWSHPDESYTEGCSK